MGVVTGGGGGGTTFNGGTITQPLTVDVGSLSSAGGLTLQGTSGANVDRLQLAFPHQTLELTGDGNLTIASDDTLAVVFAGNNATDATLSVDGGTGDQAFIGTNGGGGLLAAQKNTADTVKLGWNGSANIAMFAANSIPADAVLVNSSFALWLDATNGASKLMVKAKSANGTVVTGSLALT